MVIKVVWIVRQKIILNLGLFGGVVGVNRCFVVGVMEVVDYFEERFSFGFVRGERFWSYGGYGDGQR